MNSGSLKKTHSCGGDSTAISPDFNTIACDTNSGTIELRNMMDYSLKRTLGNHRGIFLGALEFSPDGTTLVSASSPYSENKNGTIKIWNTVNGSLKKTFAGSSGLVVFSPDGKTFVIDHDDAIKFYDATSGNLTKTLTVQHQPLQSVAFSPNGSTFVIAANDNTLSIRDAAGGTLKQTLGYDGHHSLSVTFSPDGQTIANAGLDNTIMFWRAK